MTEQQEQEQLLNEDVNLVEFNESTDGLFENKCVRKGWKTNCDSFWRKHWKLICGIVVSLASVTLAVVIPLVIRMKCLQDTQFTFDFVEIDSLCSYNMSIVVNARMGTRCSSMEISTGSLTFFDQNQLIAFQVQTPLNWSLSISSETTLVSQRIPLLVQVDKVAGVRAARQLIDQLIMDAQSIYSLPWQVHLDVCVHSGILSTCIDELIPWDELIRLANDAKVIEPRSTCSSVNSNCNDYSFGPEKMTVAEITLTEDAKLNFNLMLTNIGFASLVRISSLPRIPWFLTYQSFTFITAYSNSAALLPGSSVNLTFLVDPALSIYFALHNNPYRTRQAVTLSTSVGDQADCFLAALFAEFTMPLQWYEAVWVRLNQIYVSPGVSSTASLVTSFVGESSPSLSSFLASVLQNQPTPLTSITFPYQYLTATATQIVYFRVRLYDGQPSQAGLECFKEQLALELLSTLTVANTTGEMTFTFEFFPEDPALLLHSIILPSWIFKRVEGLSWSVDYLIETTFGTQHELGGTKKSLRFQSNWKPLLTCQPRLSLTTNWLPKMLETISHSSVVLDAAFVTLYSSSITVNTFMYQAIFGSVPHITLTNLKANFLTDFSNGVENTLVEMTLALMYSSFGTTQYVLTTAIWTNNPDFPLAWGDLSLTGTMTSVRLILFAGSSNLTFPIFNSSAMDAFGQPLFEAIWPTASMSPFGSNLLPSLATLPTSSGKSTSASIPSPAQPPSKLSPMPTSMSGSSPSKFASSSSPLSAQQTSLPSTSLSSTQNSYLKAFNPLPIPITLELATLSVRICCIRDCFQGGGAMDHSPMYSFDLSSTGRQWVGPLQSVAIPLFVVNQSSIDPTKFITRVSQISYTIDFGYKRTHIQTNQTNCS